MKHVIYDKHKYKFQRQKMNDLLLLLLYFGFFGSRKWRHQRCLVTNDKKNTSRIQGKKRWNKEFYREKWPRQWLSAISKFADHYYTSSIFHYLPDQLVFTTTMYTIKFQAQTKLCVNLNIQPEHSPHSTWIEPESESFL